MRGVVSTVTDWLDHRTGFRRLRRYALDERLDVLADLTLEELRGVGTRGPHDVTLEPCTDHVAHRLSLPCRLPPQHRSPSS